MIEKLSVTLRNIPGSVLVVHQFSEKSKKEIRDKQQKKVKKAKEIRDVEEEFLAARYVDANGKECIPITALKKALVSAAPAFDGLKKVGLRQALFVACADDPAASLLPIENHNGTLAIGIMREDAVTIGINTRGLTYRPEYTEWQLRIVIEFNSQLISRGQLVALVNQAGWGVGVCEGRPEKTSALGWGRFSIVSD